jgi:hypothetical protein
MFMDKKIIFLILLLLTLGICVYKTRKQKKISNLFLGFFSLLFLLLVIEFVYRNFLKGKKMVSTVNSYYQYDSLMGYKFKDTGALAAIEYYVGGDTIYNTDYTILTDTSRGEFKYPFRKGYKSSEGNRETVFLGCSVTFGECLSDEQTLPYQYGKLTGISAVNRGYNGFGIHQVYQTFKLEYAHQDNHNRVFVYSFLPDHFVRATGVYTWNSAGPYFTISGDSLVYKGPLFKFKKIKGQQLAYYASFFGAFSFIRDNIEKIALGISLNELNNDDVAAGYIMLKQMAEFINRTGGRLIILNWDRGYKINNGLKILDQHTINQRIADEVSSSGALVLPVSEVIDFSNPAYFVPKDGHPAAITNQIIAEYLLKNIK